MSFDVAQCTIIAVCNLTSPVVWSVRIIPCRQASRTLCDQPNEVAHLVVFETFRVASFIARALPAVLRCLTAEYACINAAVIWLVARSSRSVL